MRVLDRHIFSSLTAVFFLALASLLLLFFSVLILRYSRLISEHHQVLSAVVATCVVGIPMHVSFFVPPAAGIAAFLCMRGWQRDGAWLGGVVSGYDVRRWRVPFLLFAFLCSLIGWMFTLWLGPYGARAYFSRVNDLYADRFFLSTEPKRFVELTEGVELWVESKPTQDDLRNLVLTIQKDESTTIVAAQSGRLLRSKDGLMFEARNGTVLRFDENASQTISFQRLRYGLESLLNPSQDWQDRWEEWTRLEIPTTLLLERIARARQGDTDIQTLDSETRQKGEQGGEQEGEYESEYEGEYEGEQGSEYEGEQESEYEGEQGSEYEGEQGNEYEGEQARREFVLRLAYPLLSPVYVLAIFALCIPTRARGKNRWDGLFSFSFLLLYSTAHIYAITLSERGGLATASVFLISAAVCLGAYLLAERKATRQT